MPRRGYGNSARGFNPGNRPINGSALKGRKLTWINPTHIASQNEFRVCLAVLETHPESLFCDGHDLPHRRPEAGRTPSPARANRPAPPIGVRRTARMAFDFWWRK